MASAITAAKDLQPALGAAAGWAYSNTLGRGLGC
jgi:hypothetical protein